MMSIKPIHFRGLLLILFIANISAAQEQANAITLHSDVTIKATNFSLADLLPSGISPELQRHALAISLGHAPQPGTLREITRDEILARISSDSLLKTNLMVPERIFVRTLNYIVKKDSIEKLIDSYLLQQGWQENNLPSAAAFKLFSGTRSKSKNPSLEVVKSAFNLQQNQMQIQVRCQDRSECGSFLIAIPVSLATRGSKTSPFIDNLTGSSSIETKKPSPALVRAGKSALLLLQSDGIRIQVPVICLQRGVLKEKVRVRDAATHRVIEARVEGPGLLSAAF